MKNLRGNGDRVLVKAAAARVSGQVVVEQNWAGIAMTDAAQNAFYTLMVAGVFEIPFIASSVKGDTIAIHHTTFALTRRAPHVALTAGDGSPFAKVVAVPLDGADANPVSGGVGTEPKSGFMWVRLFGPHNIVPV